MDTQVRASDTVIMRGTRIAEDALIMKGWAYQSFFGTTMKIFSKEGKHVLWHIATQRVIFEYDA